MDWKEILLLFLGAAIGIVLDKLVYTPAMSKRTAWKDQAFYRDATAAWQRVEQLFGRLTLVQAGWAKGYMPEGTVTLELAADFQLDPELQSLRQEHAAGWLSEKRTDDVQVGIRSMSITRVSDSHLSERLGTSHHIHISAHRYRYFDFLTTHRLLAFGTPAEKATLRSAAGRIDPHTPIGRFPNPCSVGLSVICETVLLLR